MPAMASAYLPSKAVLAVHEGATICPVLSDVPVPLLEQMQRANCELFPRDDGDVVVFTPHGGDGYTIASFFSAFPQIYQVLDMESIEQFGPFLDEETAEILRSRTEEAQAARASQNVYGAGLEPETTDLGNARADTRSAPALGGGFTSADSLVSLRQVLRNSLSRAENAIDMHMRDFREEHRALQVERGQISEEKQQIDKQREELAQKEKLLQDQLEEVDRLRAEIEGKNPKKGFLWC